MLRLILAAIATVGSFYGALFAFITAFSAGHVGGWIVGRPGTTLDLLRDVLFFFLYIAVPTSLWRLFFRSSVVIRELWLIALVVAAWGAIFILAVHLWV